MTVKFMSNLRDVLIIQLSTLINAYFSSNIDIGFRF